MERGRDTGSLARLRSSLDGMAWPALPAGGAANLFALLYQLDQTQGWTPARLRENQFRQLAPLLKHAHESVPFYRDKIGGAGFNPDAAIRESWFFALPSLSRAD